VLNASRETRRQRDGNENRRAGQPLKQFLAIIRVAALHACETILELPLKVTAFGE
jgi:hypothetical protein